MEQIVQLRTMRDEALERLQANPDFKLVNSLDALIKDLEAVVVPVAVQPTVSEAPLAPTNESQQAAIEDIAAELEAVSPDAVEMTSPESSEMHEEFATMAEELPDDTAAAIEALEAELSQSPSLVEADNSVDTAAIETNSTIN